jgi:hypothetical protein
VLDVKNVKIKLKNALYANIQDHKKEYQYVIAQMV